MVDPQDPGVPDPDSMSEADRGGYWVEFYPGGFRVMEGESKQDSEVIDDREDWLTGVLLNIDRDAGDYPDSRVYRVRSPGYDKPLLFWGKKDIDMRVDGEALEPPVYVAIRMTEETEEVVSPDGKIRDMAVYEVRFSTA